MNLFPIILLLNLTISQHQAHLNATLARASALGDTGKITNCLRDGANVNTRTILDQTPLELAVEYHHYSASRLLLDSGAHVNSGSSFGTPLTWAAQDGDVAITHLLLDRGAWVDYGSQFLTPLTAALLSITDAHKASGVIMGMEVQISPDTPHNRRLGQQIKEKEEEQEARKYIGSQPGALEKRRSQSLKIVHLLLAHGADVNRKGNMGSTPLMGAVLAESAEAARLLIDHGANVKAKDETGMTALYYASLSGATELVKYLISKGADVNAQDRGGTTALFPAVQGQNVEMVRLLLASGADPKLKEKDGTTLLQLAKQFGDPDIIALLTQAGAKE